MKEKSSVIKAAISGLFPTPIYQAKLNRKFTKRELRFVEKTKTKIVSNFENFTSIDKYVLDNPSSATLKKEMELFVEDYFSKILAAPKTVIPYITQSWLNYTEPKESHHKHSHPNSYVSGVLYINANKAHDKITFAHNRYEQIKISNTGWNLFNSDSWFFTVESGDVIMFPSRLTHLVKPTKGKDTRISLSFNIFVKGNLGLAANLTELKR